MTDHKFTEEQIIEALEIRMPHDAVCREAYDLINRQKCEIERLEKSLADQFNSYENIRKKAKSEAIKEFAERLKKKAYPDDSINTQYVVDVEDINDLVKERTADSK